MELANRPFNLFNYISLFLFLLGYGFVIILTFIIGYFLTLIPGSIWSLPVFYPLELRLPAPIDGLNHYDWLGLLQYFKPQWTLILVIYWALARPQIMGIVAAWFAGLVLDILQVGLIGEYALVFSIVCYLTLVSRTRILRYSRIQQMIAVFALLVIGQLLVACLQWMMGHPPMTWAYGWSSVSGALLWPLILIILPKLER